MLTDRVRKLSPINIFLYWIKEREAIRRRKEAGKPKPWTDDEILQRYRFCNVRRMDDKVSRWLLDNWYEPYKDHPNMVIACVLARHFNNPEALAVIGFPEQIDLEGWTEKLKRRKADGMPVFNGAYIIRADGAYPSKIDMVLDQTVRQFLDKPFNPTTSSLRQTVDGLMKYRNIGSFMAGQIGVDLRWGLTGTWKDRTTWAPIGPGSSKGMNLLHGRPILFKLKQHQFDRELAALTAVGRKALPGSCTDRLEAIDWQNCLCEYSKYVRTLNGTGTPKLGYDGKG